MESHLRSEHSAYIAEYESKGMKSSLARVENLRKPGARMMDSWRASQHLRELKPLVSKVAYKLAIEIVNRITLEAGIILGGKEDEMKPRYYKELRLAYDVILS